MITVCVFAQKGGNYLEKGVGGDINPGGQKKFNFCSLGVVQKIYLSKNKTGSRN